MSQMTQIWVRIFCFLVSHRCLDTLDTWCTEATCMLESIYCTNTQLGGECFTTQCHYKILFSQICSDSYHTSSDVLYARYIKRPWKQGHIRLWEIQTHNNKSTEKGHKCQMRSLYRYTGNATTSRIVIVINREGLSQSIEWAVVLMKAHPRFTLPLTTRFAFLILSK